MSPQLIHSIKQLSKIVVSFIQRIGPYLKRAIWIVLFLISAFMSHVDHNVGLMGRQFISCLQSTMNSDQKDPFCYWDVRNFIDAMICSAYLLIALGVLIVTGLRLKKIKRYGEQARRIARIHILIVIWAITLSFQILLGLSIYFTVIYSQESEVNLGTMEEYSRMYVRMDSVPAFLITTIFLSICKIFLKGLMGSIPISLMASWEIKFMKMVQFYYYMRIFLIGGSLIMINIAAVMQGVEKYLTAVLLTLIVDCIIANIILVISRMIMMRRFKEAQRFDEEDLSKLKREYTIMIIVSVVRIFSDVFFLILPLVGFIQAADCLASFDDGPVRTIVFNGLGIVTNNILPIIWVLKIYNLSSFEVLVNRSESLVQSKSQLFQSILHEED